MTLFSSGSVEAFSIDDDEVEDDGEDSEVAGPSSVVAIPQA